MEPHNMGSDMPANALYAVQEQAEYQNLWARLRRERFVGVVCRTTNGTDFEAVYPAESRASIDSVYDPGGNDVSGIDEIDTADLEADSKSCDGLIDALRNTSA
jgi:hypothetical protein